MSRFGKTLTILIGPLAARAARAGLVCLHINTCLGIERYPSKIYVDMEIKPIPELVRGPTIGLMDRQEFVRPAVIRGDKLEGSSG